MLTRVLRWVAIGLGVAWLLSLAIFAMGVVGLFGQERDPMSAAFLMILGLPWTRLVDMLPEGVWPAALAVAPGINVLIVWLIARLAGRIANRT